MLIISPLYLFLAEATAGHGRRASSCIWVIPGEAAKPFRLCDPAPHHDAVVVPFRLIAGCFSAHLLASVHPGCCFVTLRSVSTGLRQLRNEISLAR